VIDPFSVEAKYYDKIWETEGKLELEFQFHRLKLKDKNKAKLEVFLTEHQMTTADYFLIS